MVLQDGHEMRELLTTLKRDSALKSQAWKQDTHVSVQSGKADEKKGTWI